MRLGWTLEEVTITRLWLSAGMIIGFRNRTIIWFSGKSAVSSFKTVSKNLRRRSRGQTHILEERRKMNGRAHAGSLIRLDNVSKSFHSGLSCEIYPLNSINLDVDQGERIILLGKSGSGKTTFLNLVGGVDVPTSGDYFFRRSPDLRHVLQRISPIPKKRSGFHISGVQSFFHVECR